MSVKTTLFFIDNSPFGTSVVDVSRGVCCIEAFWLSLVLAVHTSLMAFTTFDCCWHATCCCLQTPTYGGGLP